MRSPFLWKLYVSYALLILVAFALTGGLLSTRVAADARDGIRTQLEDQARFLAEITREQLERGVSPDLERRVRRLGSDIGTRLTLIDATGRVLADSEADPGVMDNHAERPEVLAARKDGTGSSRRFSRTVRDELMYVAVRIGPNEDVRGFARAAIALSGVRARVYSVRRTVFLAAGIAALAALLLGYVVARQFTAPLRTITLAVREIEEGDYTRRVPVQSRDELGELAEAFNVMGERLRDRMDQLRTDKGKLVAILGAMVEGVVAVDGDERVLHMNEVALRILGARPDRFLGRPLWEVTRVSDLIAIVTRCLAEDRELEAEGRVSTEEGEIFVELHASPLRGEEGPTGVVVILHDVTRLRHLQEVRRDFVANASHELKTPITAIRGMVETLTDDPDIAEEVRDRFLRRVKIQSDRLSALVSDLLTVSRLESGTRPEAPEAVDVRGVAREACRALAAAAEKGGLVLECVVPETPVSVRADRTDLRQIVDNLVDNAVKYTERGGRVTVEVQNEGEGGFLLEVRDSGCGIAAEHRERIFERFYRVDKARSRELGGTGLGLAIVKHTARAMGGTVGVESAPGRGSTFWVRVPGRPAAGGASTEV